MLNSSSGNDSVVSNVQDFDFDLLPVKINFVGKTKRDDWECFHWTVEFTYKGGAFTKDYFTGMGHVTKPKKAWMEPKPVKPDNKAIMAALLSDAEIGNNTFQDFCSDMGYSDDSIKAFNIYRECGLTATQLRKVFTREQLQIMRDALVDY